MKTVSMHINEFQWAAGMFFQVIGASLAAVSSGRTIGIIPSSPGCESAATVQAIQSEERRVMLQCFVSVAEIPRNTGLLTCILSILMRMSVLLALQRGSWSHGILTLLVFLVSGF